MQDIYVTEYRGKRFLLRRLNDQEEDTNLWLPEYGKETLLKDQRGQVYLIRALKD
ncbi:unnamed protein product, partial [marine sediment metagenome]